MPALTIGWGFCFFNNIAVALAKLQAGKMIESALILDFDLHFGDGTDNIFAGSDIRYFQPKILSVLVLFTKQKRFLKQETNYSILAVSAGFDRHVQDWGHSNYYR